jgi:hypothetical protein
VKYYQTTQKNSLEQLGVKPLVYLKSALSTLSNYVLKTISNVGHPGSDLHGDLPIPVNDAGSSTLFTSEDWLKAMNGLGYIDAYVDCNFTAWDKERFTHPFLYSLTNPLKYSLLWISNIFHILLLVPPIILPKPETDASLLTGQTTVTSRSLTTTVTITTRPKKAKEKKYNKMLQALTGGLVVPPSIDTAAGASLIIPPPNEITNVIEQIRDNQIEGKLLYLQNCGDGSWSGAVKGSEAAMLDQTAPLEKKKTPYWEHLLLDETDSFLSYARISPIGVGGGGGGGGYGQMDDMGTMREGGGVISYIAVITSVDKSLWLITEYPGTSPDDVEIDKVIIRRKSVNEEKVEPKKVEVDVDGEEPLPEVEIFDDPNVIPLEFMYDLEKW